MPFGFDMAMIRLARAMQRWLLPALKICDHISASGPMTCSEDYEPAWQTLLTDEVAKRWIAYVPPEVRDRLLTGRAWATDAVWLIDFVKEAAEK